MAEWIIKQDLSKCYLQEIHSKYKDIGRMEDTGRMKSIGKIDHVNIYTTPVEKEYWYHMKQDSEQRQLSETERDIN